MTDILQSIAILLIAIVQLRHASWHYREAKARLAELIDGYKGGSDV